MAEFGQTLLFIASVGVSAYAPASPSSLANLSLLDESTHSYLLAAWQAEQQGDSVRAARYARLVAPPEEVPYRIVLEDGAAQTAEALQDLALEAIGQWSAAGVAFVPSDRTDVALKIVFRDRVQGRRGFVAGITRTQRVLSPEGSVTIRAEIEISTRSPSGALLPNDAILKTLLHEMGHFFGLKDCPDPSNIMGPVRLGASNVIRLDERQWQTIGFLSSEAWRLSSLAPQATVDPRDRKPRVFTFPSL
jgi:hypothetical protein